MKRKTFDDAAPADGPEEPRDHTALCRACARVTLTKFLLEQGGLCRPCFNTYLLSGNAGLGIYRRYNEGRP